MSRDPRRPPQGGAGLTQMCHIKATTSLACVEGKHANQPWYHSCTILYKTKLRLVEKNQSGAPCTGQVHLQPEARSFLGHEETSRVSFFPLLFLFIPSRNAHRQTEGGREGGREIAREERGREAWGWRRESLPLRLGSGGHHATIEKGEVTDERNGGGGDAEPATG